MNLDKNDSPYLYEMLTNGPRKNWKMKPWQGILVFILLLLFFQMIGGFLYIYSGLGYYANGVAEMLFFFGGSLLTAKLMGLDLKEVFPLKLPNLPGICGTLLMWFGSYQCMTALVLVAAALFPQLYYSEGGSMNAFVTGFSFLGSVLVVALVPAVSEEMLHRGILQYSLQSLKKKWLIITLMGVYFGVFHLSILRFLPMMFLGMVIAWLRQESGSLVYGILFHFANNFYSLAVTFLGGQTSETVSAQSYVIPLYMIGYYFLVAAAGPFLLYLGGWLVKRAVSGHRIQLFHGNRKEVIFMVAATIVLAAVGLILFFEGIIGYLR